MKNYSVVKVSKEMWVETFSEKAHSSSFGEYRPKASERIDFALIVAENMEPIGYATCIEMDAHTLYWQMGGAFKHSQKTRSVVPGFLEIYRWSLNNYRYVSTRVSAENVAMLHLEMKMGFRICGTRTFGGVVYCDLLAEKGA